MRKIMFAAALFTFLISIPPVLSADEALEAQIERLIEEYGTNRIIRTILRERGTKITVEMNGGLHSTYGTPEPNLVTPRSILFDIQQTGLTAESFAARIKTGEMKAEAERLRQAQFEADWQRDAAKWQRGAEGRRRDDEDRETQYEYRQREMEDTRKRVEKHDRAIAEANQAQAEADAAWRQEMREEERLIIEAEKVKAMNRQTREIEGLEGDVRDQKRAMEELQRDIQLRDLLSR